jgi:hypothetical protein
VVLALSFILLMIAFRSLLIPLQAAVMNLLCVGAAFGVLTATFQWGWGLDLVRLPSPYGTVPIASYVPLMMFAALFGLSMDYEVFLVSQIAAHHAAGEAPRQAVRSGLAASAKVIAAAATIMIAVFGSFILNADPTVKQFGVGLSVAVLLATAAFQQELWHIPPADARPGGGPVLVHTFDQVASGLVETQPDVFHISTSNGPRAHESFLHRLDLRRWNPGEPVRAEAVLQLDAPASGLAGSCLLAPGVIALADSLAGLIWRVDPDR